MLAAAGAHATDASPAPGRYQVEVRIALPNVQDVAAPLLLSLCISENDVRSGRAFFILSDNPLKTCDVRDFQRAADGVSYRIVCPGHNRGSAFAVFETTRNSYRGSIKMNMGGKNMTMSETQVGTWVGECR
jgi:hypothetical protein